MRTGAIFARGSCRALKWMALFGVVFALGAVEAAAQAPTLDTAEWTPESATVTIDASESVWTQGAPASAFTVTWTGPDGSPATGESHTIPTSVDDAEDDFTVTFDKPIPTGAQSVAVNYAAPDPADPTKDILDTDTGGYTAVGTAAVSTVTERNVRPTITAIDDMTFEKDEEITAFQLPVATGNAAFTYIVSDLPVGLTFDSDGADDASTTAAEQADDRMVSGTPTTVTDGGQIVTYTATDGSTPPDSASVRFMITVTDEPAAPAAPTVTPTLNTSGSLYVMWTAPAHNNSAIFDYEVQYRVVDAPRWVTHTADLGTRTSATFDELTDGTEYEFQVRARNDVGWSDWSMSGTGTPMASGAVPDAPAMPTVTATANTRGSLDVMWVAPADNGSAIIDYSLQYRVKGAANWTVMTAAVTGTSTTLSGMPDGTTYEVQVRARNTNGSSAWSPSGEGATADPPEVPDAPAAPTVTATANTQGSLDVMWVAPADNGSAIIDYGLQYRVKGAANWTVMTAAVTGTSTTLSGMPASTTYEVQVRARNANGSSAWSPSGEGTTADPPVLPDLKGQITEMKVTGEVMEKTIGGTKRVHVAEGEVDAHVSLTVQWDHAELTALHAAGVKEVRIWLELQGAREMEQIYALPDWLSWIDDEGDVDFPNTSSRLGELGAWFVMPLPAAPKATDFPNSIRHHKSNTETIRLLIHHDEHEAENDAFYVEATYSDDVDLGASDARNLSSPLIVIEDDDPQEVTVMIGKSAGPTTLYENVGSQDFVVAADPPRIDLPLTVRLDVVDVGDTTVKAATFSLSQANFTLNAGRDGSEAGNSAEATIRMPNPDGNREDDKYDLQASVVLYSLSSGGYDTIPVVDHRINVIDIHNLPPLTVMPTSAEVMEDGERELTLTVNRNPADTIAIDPETRRYTSEALTINVTTGGDATMGSDYSLSSTAVMVEKHDGKAPWTQSVKVKVEVAEDDDVEAMEMLDLGFTVTGNDDAKNGARPLDRGGQPALASAGPGPDAEASLTLTDKTDKLVSVRDNAYDVIQGALGTPPTLMTGMSAELMGANLFDYDSAAVSVAYATSVDGGAVTASASGGTLTIMGASAGEAKVTITATATPNGSSLVVNQTKSNVAQLTFPVMVEDPPLSFTVKGPDDMNLVEGGMGGMVTVMTNRPVSENTEVMLMRDGSSSASDADFELDPPLVTIMANQKEGHTMVMAVEDDMMENADNMPEMLTLFLVVDGMQMTGEDQSVSFYLWDAAVPALPIIAQLLLAAFLAVGGYRRYLRR